MANPQPLILASSSSYRKDLLARLKLDFQSVAANIDESAKAEETPAELVKRLSIEKARWVAQSYPQHWVIGSDQLAFNGQQRLGKPNEFKVGFKQLKQASDQQIEFITGVALCCEKTQQMFYQQNLVQVKFLKLTDDMITNYLQRDKPFDCAGSFKVESLGISLFEWVKSDDPTSLEGLPLISLCQLLRQAGIEPLA